MYYGKTMDKICECANNFKKLLNKKYVFVFSLNRKIQRITLNFKTTDFRHIAGLHYIDDISIEGNPEELFNLILEESITDSELLKSRKYSLSSIEGGSVKDRINELCFLEKYLDVNNFIRIFQVQDFGSRIKADYFIESSDMARHSTAYIFFRKREEDDNFVIVSFFKKTLITYKGINLYWMLKEKYENKNRLELYRHPNYNM